MLQGNLLYTLYPVGFFLWVAAFAWSGWRRAVRIPAKAPLRMVRRV